MKQSFNTLLITLALAPLGAYAQAPEAGRWITQSGNLEVEIAPCGEALCGTVVRVIAEQAMAGPGMPSAPSAPSPLGRQILFNLKPVAGGGGHQGFIYNRGDNKTYNTLVVMESQNALKLTAYQDTPARGMVQIWKRAGVSE